MRVALVASAHAQAVMAPLGVASGIASQPHLRWRQPAAVLTHAAAIGSPSSLRDHSAAETALGRFTPGRQRPSHPRGGPQTASPRPPPPAHQWPQRRTRTQAQPASTDSPVTTHRSTPISYWPRSTASLRACPFGRGSLRGSALSWPQSPPGSSGVSGIPPQLTVAAYRPPLEGPRPSFGQLSDAVGLS